MQRLLPMVFLFLATPIFAGATAPYRLSPSRLGQRMRGRIPLTQTRSRAAELRGEERWHRIQARARFVELSLHAAAPPPRNGARKNGHNGHAHPAVDQPALPETLAPDEYGAVLKRWHAAGVVVIRGKSATDLLQWATILAFDPPVHKDDRSSVYLLSRDVAARAAQKEHETLEGMKKMRMPFAFQTFGAAAAQALHVRTQITRAASDTVVLLTGEPPKRAVIAALDERLAR